MFILFLSRIYIIDYITNYDTHDISGIPKKDCVYNPTPWHFFIHVF